MKRRVLTPKRTEYGKAIRKQYESGGVQEKRSNMVQLEPRNDGLCNTITTVLKDNLVLGKATIMEDVMEEKIEDKKTVEDYLYTAKDGEQYGIFKLSPRECGRLMGVKDSDIDKMLAVNSNSQCYKQYGNSIVVPVLCAIFSQLNIEGVKSWNQMTEEEREEWINPDGLSAEK